MTNLPMQDSDGLKPELLSSTVDFRLSNNLIIVDAAINGISAPMIIDTGAGRTIIDRAAAKIRSLYETGESCTGKGAGGDVELLSVEVDSLCVGSVNRRRFTSLTMDLSDLRDNFEHDVDGIVGFDFLSHLRLTIDYPARQLVLEETRQNPHA